MFHSQIITQIIDLVATKEKTDQIFNFSKKRYDLHQFNVGSLYPKDVKKMNESLKRRYRNQEIEILPTNWNQGERRLFVWVIICFLYEKQIKIEEITEEDLVSLSKVFYQKDTIFLDFQLRNLPKVTKAKKNWSPEEDELLKSAIKTLKGDLEESKLFNNWNDVAKIIFFQTEREIFRTPKSCRERWYNHLDESKKKDEFSVEEDLTLINFILNESKSWSKIVKIMNYSRTQHRIKNRYYTLIRKYQRSFENTESEQLTEQAERNTVLKIKAFLEVKREKLASSNQVKQQKGKIPSNGIKAEEKGFNQGEAEENKPQKSIYCLNSNESLKVKTQTDNLQFESDQKVEVFAEEEIEMKILSSSVELKDNSKGCFSYEEGYQANPQYFNHCWPQISLPYTQYAYQMNMMPQQSFEPTQVIFNPINNQFYYPIIYQNGMEYQFYQQ